MIDLVTGEMGELLLELLAGTITVAMLLLVYQFVTGF